MNLSILPATHAARAKLTRTEWGRIVDLKRHPTDRLVDSGWATLRLEDAAALARRGTVTADAPLPVLRLGLPDYDPDGSRRRTGIAPSYTDSELRESARRWWRCNPDQITAAGFILISVSGFVVAVLRVWGCDDAFAYTTPKGHRGTKHSFAGELAARVDDLVTGKHRILLPDDKVVRTLTPALGNRVPNPAGAPLISVHPDGRIG